MKILVLSRFTGASGLGVSDLAVGYFVLATWGQNFCDGPGGGRWGAIQAVEVRGRMSLTCSATLMVKVATLSTRTVSLWSLVGMGVF